MRTKVSLSVIGIFNVLMALVMALAIKDMAPQCLIPRRQKQLEWLK